MKTLFRTAAKMLDRLSTNVIMAIYVLAIPCGISVLSMATDGWSRSEKLEMAATLAVAGVALVWLIRLVDGLIWAAFLLRQVLPAIYPSATKTIQDRK